MITVKNMALLKRSNSSRCVQSLVLPLITMFSLSMPEVRKIVFSINITAWYGIILGTFFTIWLLYRVLSRILNMLRVFCTLFLLKHLIYPNLYPRMPFFNTITRFQSLIVVAFVAVNILCMTVGINSSDQIGKRAGLMSIINLIPLFTGSRLSTVANYLGISLRAYTRMHRYMARMAVLQGVVHTCLNVSRQQLKWDAFEISGVVV